MDIFRLFSISLVSRTGLWDGTNVEFTCQSVRSLYGVWPLIASMEVKNKYVYVITQDICNKFIEVKNFVECIVSPPNRLLQDSTTMSLINNKIKHWLDYLRYSNVFDENHTLCLEVCIRREPRSKILSSFFSTEFIIFSQQGSNKQ